MDQVDEVKQKTDIVSIIGERVELKKAGRNYKALCPFHSEKTPSFMVSPELQMFKCFGCGEAGDVIAFLEKFEGMEFREALKFLADRVGIKLTSFRPGEEGEKEKLYQINSLASRFYNYILLNHRLGKPALDYLTAERGLSLGTIKTFQLGFSPDVPGAISKFLVEKKKFKAQDLEKAGLAVIVDGKIFDRFRGRIIFPLFDHRGNVVGFTGRIVPWVKAEVAKYVNSPETPVYHKSRVLYGLNFSKEEIKKEGSAILVEGQMDAIPLWQAGIKNVVAINGTALTEDQVKLISRFTKNVIFSLDTDFAGDTAARRGIAVAQKEGLAIKVAKLSGFKDPGEAAKADPQGYKKVLEGSVGIWDYIVDSVFARADAKSGEGKLKISQEIVPILASIGDKIVQAHYVDIVARKLAIPVEAVLAEVEKVLREEEEKPKVVSVLKEPEKGRRQLLEERLLSLAFASDPKILLKEEVGNLVATPLTKRILEEYRQYSKDHKEFSASAFASGLPKELFEGFAEIALRDTEEFIDDPESLERELGLVKHELEILTVRHTLEILGGKIRKFEQASERAKLKEVQSRFSELSQRLASLEEEDRGGIILRDG